MNDRTPKMENTPQEALRRPWWRFHGDPLPYYGKPSRIIRQFKPSISAESIDVSNLAKSRDKEE
jgi:hypothetical protein